LASAHAKATLIPLVENHPDCSEDMDILGFSLYHENNHNVAKVSDDDDASDNSKR